MLRGPRQAGIDIIAPSDLRAIYLDASRARSLPVAYAVGFTPRDYIAAMCRCRRWTSLRSWAPFAARRFRSSNA